MPTYNVCCSTGNDANDGLSLQNAFKTIQQAAIKAIAGDIILVQPGIYRERVSPVNTGTATAPITYLSAVPRQAIIRGSCPWIPSGQLNDNSNILVGPVSDNLFTDTTAIDGANPFKIKSIVTPYNRNGFPEVAMGVKGADPQLNYCLGQVFVNDNMLVQTPYYKEMASTQNSWFYDSSSELLHVNITNYDPAIQYIEVTNQRRVFAPHKRGLRYIIVDGFTIERCANHYPNKFWVNAQAQQAGMIGTRSGRYWTIQNNTIRFATGVGIDWGNEGGQNQDLEIPLITGVSNGPASGSYGHVIKNNHICDNGAAGTASYMGKNFTFINNIVERNNNLQFYGIQRWESAGLKVHQPTNSIIDKNIIRNNWCNGIWSDQGSGVSSVFQNNIIHDNSGSGINFEIGVGMSGVVQKNVFWNNQTGIYLVTSGGVSIKNNVFLGSTIADIKTTIFSRPTDKWDSNNITISSNLFSGNTNMPFLALTTPSATVPSSRFLNNNLYGISSLTDSNRFILYPEATNKGGIQQGFTDWKNNWSKFNNSVNGDELSTIVPAGCAKINILENNQYSLELNLPENIELSLPSGNL